MYVQIAVAHSFAGFGREQVVIHEGFCGLRCKLHHHSRRGIGIHVRILAGYIVVFCLDDFQEYVASLSTTGNAALVAIGDVAFSHLLSGRFHQFQFHAVLNLLHCHLILAGDADTVGYFLY